MPSPIDERLISPTGQEIPAKDLEKLRRVKKHAGPGPHPGTGTPQSVHGGGGPGLRPEFTFDDKPLGPGPLVPDVVDDKLLPFEAPDRDHELGSATPSLMAILREGKPMRERFKVMLSEKDANANVLIEEYRVIQAEWGDLGAQEGPVNRRLAKTISMLATAESRRYPGLSRDSSVLEFLSDADKGKTITQRIEAWRSQADVTKIEVKLSEAAYGATNDVTDRGLDGILEIEGQYSIEATYGPRSGKLNGGILTLNTPEAAEAWIERARDEASTESWYGGSQGGVKMWLNVAAKIETAPQILPSLPDPQDTFVSLSFAAGSQNVWGAPIKGMHPAFDLEDVTFLAGETDRTNFIGTELPPLAGWEDAGNGTWGKVASDDPLEFPVKGEYLQRIVPSKVLVDRLLEDADYVSGLKDEFNVKFAALRKLKTANTLKRLNFDRDSVSDFLVSEGIPVGLEIEMARRAGAGKGIAVSTAHMPSVWIQNYNEAHADAKLRVMKKDSGGTYWEGKWMNGSYGPVIATGGSNDSNIHEIGHGLEKLPILQDHVKDFFNYRTNFGNISGRNVAGGRIYKDSFTDAYSGKKYDWSGSYEVLSNGLGNMYGGHRGMPDDEHLDWLLGLMSRTARPFITENRFRS